MLASFVSYVQGYQFWTEADADGYFVINNIREGQYDLNAYVAGWIGDYQYEKPVNITAGKNLYCNEDYNYKKRVSI